MDGDGAPAAVAGDEDDGEPIAGAVGGGEPKRWWGWAALGLSLAGLGDSLYLTIEHFRGTVPICAANSVVDCAKVTTSPESEIFGVLPVALLGLLFFVALVTVTLPPWWRLEGRTGELLAWARLALVVSGMGMVVYLLYAELFSIKAICLWCTGVHVITFLLFVLVVATFPSTASAPVGEDP
ncbi:MAG TPA: vitamin K epoxide reductase family protein [Acidimicrobiales bacterium]|nr:vitamin K epoxide reductase family protein [Acidimicrobiales bacterium]